MIIGSVIDDNDRDFEHTFHSVGELVAADVACYSSPFSAESLFLSVAAMYCTLVLDVSFLSGVGI
jgi:hypothetical protein